jgi:transposase
LTIHVHEAEKLSLEQIQAFLSASEAIRFEGETQEQIYHWIEQVLGRQEYHQQGRQARGLLRSYLAKMTGLSRAQVTRLIARYRKSGSLQPAPYRRHRFPQRYTRTDIELLATVDEAHENLSGPATRRILEREYRRYGKCEYQRLAAISVSHLYNLRQQPRYRERRLHYVKTRPTAVAIGERRRPDPRGRPGYLRVDTVHQGDPPGTQGVFHIDAVDEVTQWQIVSASARTLIEIARDPRHLGAEIGFFSVLHTWDQRLQHHPHVHCVLAAGGFAPDHSRWISSRHSFFLPVKVLSRVFRGKFVAGLRAAFLEGDLQFHGSLAPLAEPRAFSSWLRLLFRHDWVVYSKRPFGGPEHALRYLGAYTHRVAISNRRLIALADNNVTFRWRDSAHGNKKRLMTLPIEEFLRRFLLHLLPRGFVRIRNFGFLANRQRATLLPLCRQVLGALPQPQIEPAVSAAKQPSPLWTCPNCGGPMIVVERWTAAQIQLRSPPSRLRAAA